MWSGKVRAFDANADDLWEPVGGNASLRVSLDRAAVDIDFTDFQGGHADMSWRSLALRSGAFSHSQGLSTISGAFYGSDHQGAAGTFNRDRLRGVFGAVRN